MISGKSFFSATVCLCALGACLFSGCAAMMKRGASKSVQVVTEPAGAQVHIDGTLVGTTPCQLDLALKKDHLLEFSKDGYEKQAVLVGNRLGAGWVVSDFFMGLLAISMGAMFAYGSSTEGEDPGGFIGSLAIIGLGAIPVAVDAKTGAWNHFEHDSLNVTLNRKH